MGNERILPGVNVLLVFLALLSVAMNVDAKKKKEAAGTLKLFDDGLFFSVEKNGETVGESLAAAKLALAEDDLVVPQSDMPNAAADSVFIERRRGVEIRVGTEAPREYRVLGTEVGEALEEAGISVSALDKVSPALGATIYPETRIIVNRVLEKTIETEEPIPAPVKYISDPDLPLGREEVEKPGKEGRKLLTFFVRTENGKEIMRRKTAEKVLEEAETRVIKRGTKVLVVATETGMASWYRTDPMTTAHKTLPFGTRLRVTNLSNGKSTIVKVADRGPYLPGRVVDLSTDAFSEIAPLGAGVISVKVEQLGQ